MSKLSKNRILMAAVAIGMTASLAGCNAESKDSGASSDKSSESAALTDVKANNSSADKFKSDDDRASYAIGFSGGSTMKRDLTELELATFIRGFSDGFKGEKPEITQEEMSAAINVLKTRKMAEMKEKSESAMTENKAAGEKLLATNKAREGVTTTESGLQYEVISAGDGASPSKEDTVSVHYHGTLADGTVFDSSVDRGKPTSFGVGQVIKGWTEALLLMKTGDKWKLTIPSDLAYGARGAGAKIGPNSTLVFEVELLEIVKK
ncbi:MAG: FKBP-type peptidyl-prolyl cis-trans isomerase [Pseudomonadales bacterium]|nr:FKBP-type peptidyl-prolyl cis-trans isomerase [Pseudomonadales bacterium]